MVSVGMCTYVTSNDPYIQPTTSTRPKTKQVHDWQALRGKTVAVVGAGASALDMAINALKANEGQGPEVRGGWRGQAACHVMSWYLFFRGEKSGLDKIHPQASTLTRMFYPPKPYTNAQI